MAKYRYSEFVLSYFRWYNRMWTSEHHHRYAPALFLSLLQMLNITSLSLLFLPPSALQIRKWVFALIFVAIVLTLEWINGNVIKAITERPHFSTLSAKVPGIREFPVVYSYLAITLILPFLLIFMV